MYKNPLIITNTDKDHDGVPSLVVVTDMISEWEFAFEQGITDPTSDAVICSLYELACIVYGKQVVESILNNR